METKKIVESLRLCAEKLGCHRYIIGNCEENISFGKVLDEAAERLEELEVKIEELHDFSEMQKEEISILKKQLSVQQPEWISVEDRLPEVYVDVLGFKNDDYVIITFVDEEGFFDGGSSISHWMPLPEPPKPKEPTFKDLFLKAFPKARLYGDGSPISCRANIFGEKCLMKSKCAECWNQPYFEAEAGEADV